MKTKIIFAPVLFFLVSAMAFSQAAQQAAPDKPTEVPNIAGVVAAGAKIERVWTTTTTSADGLIAAPDGTLVLPQQAASQVSKVDADGKVTLWLMDTNGAGGLAFDTKGRVIAVERVMPRVGVLFPEQKTLVDTYDGKPLEGAGDIIADLKGGVYFTEGRRTPPASAAYYIDATGKVTRIAAYDKERVNGVTLSPDGKTLYFGYGGSDSLIAYDVQPDGSVTNRRNFGKIINGQADGLAVDAASRVFVATAVGIQVLSPEGENLGTIPTPRGVTTMAFAGPGKKTLYFIGRGTDGPDGGGRTARSLYKISMLTEGFKGRAK